jgi:hypothetical protein
MEMPVGHSVSFLCVLVFTINRILGQGYDEAVAEDHRSELSTDRRSA